MKKRKLNYYQKLCKSCEENGKSGINPIETVRELLKENVKSEADLLRYRAEALRDNYNTELAFYISMSALLLSLASLFVNVISNDSNGSKSSIIITTTAYGIVSIVVIVFLIKPLKCSYTNKWRDYILVVIDELEKEIEKGTFLNEKLPDKKPDNMKKYKKKKWLFHFNMR